VRRSRAASCAATIIRSIQDAHSRTGCRRSAHARGLLFQHCPGDVARMSGGRVAGLLTMAGHCHATTVIVAGGVWSTDGLLPPCDPRCRAADERPGAWRCGRRGRPVAAPRDLDRADSSRAQKLRPPHGWCDHEDAGFNPAITAGGVLALLEVCTAHCRPARRWRSRAVWSGFTADLGQTTRRSSVKPESGVSCDRHRPSPATASYWRRCTAAAIEQLVTNRLDVGRRKACSGS